MRTIYQIEKKTATIFSFIHLLYMKNFIAGTLLALLSASAVFADEWNQYENSVIQNILQIRLNSRLYKNYADALNYIQAEHQKFSEDAERNKICDEARITGDNLFVFEEFHYMWEINPEADATNSLILSQLDSVLKWNDSHPAAERNDWYNLSAYDIINSSIPNLKMSKVMKLGLEGKKVYNMMLENGCEKGLLYINLGLWYYFAPAFGGGSKTKAAEYFSKATQTGRSDFERFFGFVYLSQVEFFSGKKNECETSLNAAEKILPGNSFTEFVRHVNVAGFSYIEYTDKRAKIQAAVEKYYQEKNEK